jgi:para-nitrobenzyl esterase
MWILIATALAAPCPTTNAPHADTTHGCVTGARSGAFEAFFGVPYAAPPTRWAPPETAQPWGVLQATTPPPNCSQLDRSGVYSGQEDCLFLNVIRPAGTTDADRLPVVFSTHGGGHDRGSGTDPGVVDHPGLVTTNGAILVTFNYRVAQLGWLSHPAMSAESPDDVSGNQGLRDALLALQWVHDNIDGFGGDPDRITLTGHSAGSFITCTLLTSPMASGRFSAVALGSGACVHGYPVLRGPLPPLRTETEEDKGRRIADALGCADVDLEAELACMRALDPETVLSTALPRNGPLDPGEEYQPSVDGLVLPLQPRVVLENGLFPAVPIVAGATDDEGTVFTALTGAPPTWFAMSRELRAYAADRGMTDPRGLVALYGSGRFASPREAWAAFTGDVVFVCPTRMLLDRVAPWTDAYGYLFTRANGPLGAAHGADVRYFYGTLDTPSAADARLSAVMQQAWGWLADGAVGGPWPRYDSDPRGVWVGFDTTIRPLTDVRQQACDFLESTGWQPLL